MYFYILRCRDNSLYSGVTTDLIRRLKEHNGTSVKCAKYTRSRQPVALVYHKKYKNKSLAMKREAEIKSWTKNKKEELLKQAQIGKPQTQSHV